MSMIRARGAWSPILAMLLAAGCADRPIDPEPSCPADRDDPIAFAAVAHVEDSEGIVLLIGRDRDGDRYVSDEIPNEVVVSPLSNVDPATVIGVALDDDESGATVLLETTLLRYDADAGWSEQPLTGVALAGPLIAGNVTRWLAEHDGALVLDELAGGEIKRVWEGEDPDTVVALSTGATADKLYIARTHSLEEIELASGGQTSVFVADPVGNVSALTFRSMVFRVGLGFLFESFVPGGLQQLDDRDASGSFEPTELELLEPQGTCSGPNGLGVGIAAQTAMWVDRCAHAVKAQDLVTGETSTVFGSRATALGPDVWLLAFAGPPDRCNDPDE